MATIKYINNLAEVENFDIKVKNFYSDSNLIAQKARYEALLKTHIENFSKAATFFSSPGRIEVIGNHTDHNNGKVLTAAISVDTLAAVSPTEDGIIVISSYGYPAVSVDTAKLAADENERGTSLALVRGVLYYLKCKGYNIGGFKATTVSDVFKGAGVSSSASFEVLVCEIINRLYNGGAITAMEKAMASQYAENVYFGKPCGLMDQSAIALGGISMIDFKCTENPEVVNGAWPFDGVEIFVINTGGDHSDLTDNYADIRSEMEEVAAYFGKRVLREVNESEFFASIPLLQNKVSGRAILRAIHFFDENRRVDQSQAAIGKKDLSEFLKIINASGDSSYKLLQNCYPEGDRVQRIPFALALASRQEGVLACRVHGGGFMGTVLALVKREYSDGFFSLMSDIFGNQNIYRLTIRGKGAAAVEL